MTRPALQLVAWAAWVSVGLASCGPQRIAGGGSSESGNAIVSGRVVDSGGMAVGGARLTLVEDEYWLAHTLAGRPVAVDSARVDAEGRFEIRVPMNRVLNLQIDGKTQGSLLREFSKSLDTGMNERVITVSPYGSAMGELIVTGGVATALRLPGTDYRAELLLSGSRYQFPALPAGRYLTLVNHGWEGDSASTPAASIGIRSGIETNVVLEVAANRLMLEDFSEPWPRSRLAGLTGLGTWYGVNDNAAPTLQRSRLERVVVDGPDHPDGPALRARVLLDSAYAGLGLHLGLKESTFDFSALRALTFMTRGKGRIRVTLESPLLDNPLDDHFEFVVDLPMEWSRIAIPVDSLRLPTGSAAAARGVTWQQVASTIIRVEFLVKREHNTPGDTIEFWLDDIFLDGVPFRNFVP